MSMRDDVVAAYRLGLYVVKESVKDLTEEQMVQQPKPGMNHAAWVLGHLCLERVFFRNAAPVELEAPAGWKELFMPGSTPVAEMGKYPRKEELLGELDATQAAVEKAFLAMSDEELAKPSANEELRGLFPTVGSLAVVLLTTHRSLHIGQLQAWRRAMGLPPAMGR